MHRHGFAFLSLLLFLSTPLLAKEPVRITFEEKAVVARVTPGATSAWFGIAHEWDRIGRKVVRRAFLVADDDRDGIVRVDVPNGLPPASFWMVVDLSSGEHAIAAPDGRAGLNRRQIPPGALHAKNAGANARLLQDYRVMTVFIARPGVGAWFGQVEDGSAADGDGKTDGNVTALLERLAPVGSSPPAPDDLSRDDIVAYAEPMTLAVFDTKVVK